MAESNPNYSGTAAAAAAPSIPGPTAGADPLDSLYKMSRTAGLGTQEYVAINATAVVALLLGFAGLLALVEPILLLIPLAAVVVAIMALVQIGRSNGTQTGRTFAILGILLALGVGGYVAAREAVAATATRSDRTQIHDLLVRFGELIRAKSYDQAYNELTTDRFKKEVAAGLFSERWSQIQGVPQTGAVKSITWNERVIFEPVPDSTERRATAMAVIHFDKAPEPGRQAMVFRNTGNGWKIDGIPQVFPPPMPAPGGPGGPPGGGPPGGPLPQ